MTRGSPVATAKEQNDALSGWDRGAGSGRSCRTAPGASWRSPVTRVTKEMGVPTSAEASRAIRSKVLSAPPCASPVCWTVATRSGSATAAKTGGGAASVRSMTAGMSGLLCLTWKLPAFNSPGVPLPSPQRGGVAADT